MTKTDPDQGTCLPGPGLARGDAGYGPGSERPFVGTTRCSVSTLHKGQQQRRCRQGTILLRCRPLEQRIYSTPIPDGVKALSILSTLTSCSTPAAGGCGCARRWWRPMT